MRIADGQLKLARAAADAAAATTQREIIADIEPPETADPKIAVMNLLQVLLCYGMNPQVPYIFMYSPRPCTLLSFPNPEDRGLKLDTPSLNHGISRVSP